MEEKNEKQIIVKLNIGGKKFNTYQETLLGKGKNFFHGFLFTPLHQIKDDEGYLFIDRNGKLFEQILLFLREGTIIVKEENYDSLKIESDFYLIKNLSDMLEELIKKTEENISLQLQSKFNIKQKLLDVENNWADIGKMLYAFLDAQLKSSLHKIYKFLEEFMKKGPFHHAIIGLSFRHKRENEIGVCVQEKNREYFRLEIIKFCETAYGYFDWNFGEIQKYNYYKPYYKNTLNEGTFDGFKISGQIL